MEKLPDDEVQLLGLIKTYKEQLRVDPASVSFFPLAQCYKKLGLSEAAVDVVKRGIEVNSDHVKGISLLADLLTASGEYDEASVLYERVLSLDEQNSEALIGMAQLDLSQNNYERAKERIDALAVEHPDHQILDHLRSQLKVDNANGDENILLSTATMAELYLKQGLKEKAISIYRSLVHHYPQDGRYRERLATLLGQAVEETIPAEKNEQIAGLEKWLFAIERRRKDV